MTAKMTETMDRKFIEWDKVVEGKIEKNIDYIMEKTLKRMVEKQEVTLNKCIDQKMVGLEEKIYVQKVETEKAEKRAQIASASESTKVREQLGQLEEKFRTMQTAGLDKVVKDQIESTVQKAQEQQKQIEKGKKDFEKECAEMKAMHEEMKKGGGGRPADTSGLVSIDEMRRIWDEERKRQDLECANVMLIAGLAGLDHEQRKTKILGGLKKTLTHSELPEKIDSPSYRSGGLSPIAFAHFPSIEARKKATPTVNGIEGLSGRVKHGGRTDSLNRLLIAIARDAGRIIFGDRRPPKSEERAKVAIDFRALTVTAENVVIARREGVDSVAVFVDKYKGGENLAKVNAQLKRV